MLVSVALCSYNGEKHIEEQILSIINQHLHSDMGLEIIIVDDISKDNTVEVVKRLKQQYDCIKLFVNQSNLGYVKNFEKAISLCSGEYILTCDQDDVWVEDKVLSLLNLFQQDTFLVYSDALLVDANLRNLDRTLLANTKPMEGDNNCYFVFNNSISGNTMMFKRDLVQYILPFPDKINFHDLWIGFVSSSIGNIQYSPRALIHYRQHNENVTNILKTKTKNSTWSEKIDNKNKFLKQRCNNVKAYADFLASSSLEESSLICKLRNELCSYEQYIFNLHLFIILWKYKDLLFVSDKQKRIGNILKNSLGLQAYRLLPFI